MGDPAAGWEKYVSLRHLATGGMAEIHLALTRGIEGFEKLVVVKRVLPHMARDEDFVRMFLDEARIAATLHHPNIVQVYDIGRDDQSHFFTMEFVHGADLSNTLRRATEARRPPTLDHALSIVLALCAGLHYAHEKEGLDGKRLGLVHRDVSPQNVLISFDGAVKLTDFGIAKAAERPGATRDGALKGKLSYMSPEQARSRPLDRRSDVFALSILLWELTTFRRLFRAASDFETLELVTGSDAPAPSRFRPEYPPELEQIVMKGLQRDPDRRYQSAEEMQLDLEELARELRLQISSVPLGRFMRNLFRNQTEAWAQAQAEGVSFPQFLATCEMPSPSSNTDTWVAPASDAFAEPPPPGRDTPPPFDIPPLFPAQERGRLSGAFGAVAVPAPSPLRRWWPVLAGCAMLAIALVVVVGMRGGENQTEAPGSGAPPPAVAVPDDAAAAARDHTAAAAARDHAATAAAEPPDAGVPLRDAPEADAPAPRHSVRSGGKPPRRPRPPKGSPKPPKPPDNGLDDLLPH